MISEATLKRDLGKTLEEHIPGAFVIALENNPTAGLPDRLISWRGAKGMEFPRPRVTWVEVKYRRPGSVWKLTERQILRLRQLRGFCVTYEQHSDGRKSVTVVDYGPGTHPDTPVWTKTWRDAHLEVVYRVFHDGLAVC